MSFEIDRDSAAMSGDNVAPLAGQEPDTDRIEQIDRAALILQHLDSDLPQFVRGAHGAETEALLEDAAAIADLIAGSGDRYSESAPIEGIADQSIPRAAFLIERLLRVVLEMQKIERAREDPELWRQVRERVTGEPES